jgi:hypothetical protein
VGESVGYITDLVIVGQSMGNTSLILQLNGGDIFTVMTGEKIEDIVKTETNINGGHISVSLKIPFFTITVMFKQNR